MNNKLLVVFFVFTLSILKHVESYGLAEGRPKSPPLITTEEGMILVKGDCYEMGDTFGEGDKDEVPVHKICVDDFYLGEHEVTQGEWKKIMGGNPSFFNDCGDDCPVEQVSYNDVQEFIEKLKEKTGENYRLPTEAEWDYAARAGGANVRFGTGKNFVGSDEANFNASPLYKKAYSRAGIFREKTVPVKSFKPNALGLYDMSGNVFEWTSDWFLMPYYKMSPEKNPKGPKTGLEGPPAGLFKVIRGGSYLSPPFEIRVADRNNRRPEYKHSVLGLRLARTP